MCFLSLSRHTFSKMDAVRGLVDLFSVNTLYCSCDLTARLEPLAGCGAARDLSVHCVLHVTVNQTSVTQRVMYQECGVRVARRSWSLSRPYTRLFARPVAPWRFVRRSDCSRVATDIIGTLCLSKFRSIAVIKLHDDNTRIENVPKKRSYF